MSSVLGSQRLSRSQVLLSINIESPPLKALLMTSSISVYGYDPDMYKLAGLDQSKKTCKSTDKWHHQLAEGSQTSPFLDLPYELRALIYSFILPSTFFSESKDVVWLRGKISILSVNHMIYDEAIKIIYGEATFAINVVWDCVTFDYKWLLPKGLVPRRTMAFPEMISSRNWSLVHNLRIRVYHVDEYTGMIKYNHGNASHLVNGVRDQVELLCKVLRKIPKICRLQIEFLNEDLESEAGDIILKPFLSLQSVYPIQFIRS